MNDNTRRFSNRVENYAKFRPTYPEAAIGYLVETARLTRASTVADIGSGTGIFTELLLRAAGTVLSVEPNDEMRKKAECRLGGKNTDAQGFISVRGTAENTTLESASVDCITVAQAFHWFDQPKAKKEFGRILKTDGWVFLVWNRRAANTPFLAAYEEILKSEIPEYNEVRHDKVTTDIIEPFFDRDFRIAHFENSQLFDWDGLIGRLKSSSYAPLPGTGTYETVEGSVRALRRARLRFFQLRNRNIRRAFLLSGL